MTVKINNQENELKIEMAKEFDVLIKQIALHENDIKRIQTLSKKKAFSKGHRKGELFRLKSTLNNQNEIIQKSKKIKPSISRRAMENRVTNEVTNLNFLFFRIMIFGGF